MNYFHIKHEMTWVSEDLKELTTTLSNKSCKMQNPKMQEEDTLRATV